MSGGIDVDVLQSERFPGIWQSRKAKNLIRPKKPRALNLDVM